MYLAEIVVGSVVVSKHPSVWVEKWYVQETLSVVDGINLQ